MKKIVIQYQDIYSLLLMIVIAQLVYVNGLVYFSSAYILNHFNASDFLQTINVVPVYYGKVPVFTFLLLIALLVLLDYQKKVKTNTQGIVVWCMEVVLSIGLMYLTNFASNMILLLLIANSLMTLKNQKLLVVNVGLSLLIYLFCNQEIISVVLPVTDLSYYMGIYTKQASILFESIKSILSTFAIVAFMGFIALYLNTQLNEKNRISKMNQDLQELNQQLEDMADMREKMGETRERNRLAREIHDTLGHTLTGLSIGLDACNTLVDVDPEMAKNQLTKLADVARNGLTEVRASVSKLRPDALAKHTLKESLDEMIMKMVNATGVKIDFVCHLQSLDFQPDEQDTIYRIVQEGVTNSLRHGHATHIYISFALYKETLIIIIEDNGIGSQDIKEGFGIHHMRERVNLLHGKVRYYSNHGFELIVEIPIRKEN